MPQLLMTFSDNVFLMTFLYFEFVFPVLFDKDYICYIKKTKSL